MAILTMTTTCHIGVSMTKYSTILVDKSDGVATITLNRPERLNAWTHEMNVELQDAIGSINDDADVGAMVFTGAGRGFCSGADIRDNFKARIDGKRQGGGGDWIDLVRSSKPMIAAVNGACVGIGATMILPMDVIIASTEAKFGMLFVKMGVTPELASSHFLTQRVGFGAANEMCLTGRLYSGEEAYAKRLADHVVAPDELLPTALGLAREMAENPSRQLRWVKQLITQNGSETDIKKVHEREGQVLTQAYDSAEHHEAVSAFLEKRKPVFKN